jgi:hypothetical protein
MTKTNMPKVIVSKSNFSHEEFEMGHVLSGETKSCHVNMAITNSLLTGKDYEKARDWSRLSVAAYKKKYEVPVLQKELTEQEENVTENLPG